MRFYKRDGSYKINQDDCEFGWWFCNVFEENQTRNCKQNKHLIFEQNEIEDSTDLTCLLKCDKKLIIEKHEPSVAIHVPVCVQKSQMSPEVYVRNDDLNPFNTSDLITFNEAKENKKPTDFEDFNSMKQNMSKMLASNVLESKLLMSFIDVHKFKTLINADLLTSKHEMESIPELAGPSLFLNCSFVAHNFNIFENQSWSSFHHQKEYYKNKKSLLTEMPTFKDFSKRNLTNLNNSMGNLKAPEKLDCLPSDSLKLSETDTYGSKCLECIKLLYQNLTELDEKIYEMQKELVQIRMDFQVEDRRTRRLIQESKQFLLEFTESNYLNKVLLLLMGQTEKVKSNKWPFKILRSNQKDELNLII